MSKRARCARYMLRYSFIAAALLTLGHAWGQPIRPCGPGFPGCLPGQECEFPIGDCAMENGICVAASACDPASGLVCGCDSTTYTDACAAEAAGVLIASLGPCPNCSTDSNCLPGDVCEFLVGDCAMANRTCLPEPGCDTASGPVCGCNSNSFPDTCAAQDAGVVVASLGACPNPDSCTNGCGPNQFCQLPEGACVRYGFLPCDVMEPMLDAIGICTTIPTDCPPDFDPVCSCDDGTFLNACEATKVGRSIARAEHCGEWCGGFFGRPCDSPTDTCVQSCAVCVFDGSARCQEDPVTCDDTCAPVCVCGVGWYRNLCQAIQANWGMSLQQSGDCGEPFALLFSSKVDMFWGSVEVFGGDPYSYNVYRAPISGTGPPGPWDCVDSSLLQPPYALNDVPAPGEAWGFVVAQVSAGIEGPLGYGGQACTARPISAVCPP